MSVAAPPTRRATRVLAAGPEHVGALMTLYVELEADRAGRDVDQAEQDAFGREAFAAATRADTDRLLVALVGRQVVGFLWARLRLVPYGEFPRAVAVHHVYVRPEWRHAKLVRDLYQALRAWATLLDAPVVVAVPFSKRVVATWRRRGYRPLTVVLTGRG